MSDTSTEDPLLSAVRTALLAAGLDPDGLLKWRAWRHPARPGAVALRGAWEDGCRSVLEAAGFRVRQEANCLAVSVAGSGA